MYNVHYCLLLTQVFMVYRLFYLRVQNVDCVAVTLILVFSFNFFISYTYFLMLNCAELQLNIDSKSIRENTETNIWIL